MGSRLMALGAGGQVGYQLIEVAKVADATWWDCPISKRTFATLMWRSRDMRQPATPLLIPPTTSQRARHRGDRLSKRLHRRRAAFADRGLLEEHLLRVVPRDRCPRGAPPTLSESGMDYRKLGRTGVKVSAICLGTMTFGQQNTEAEGHAQMDYAVDRGITIFDAAELYPIPPKPETQGHTEAIIGTWLASRKARDKVMVATKAIGRTKMDWLRKDRSSGRQSRARLIEALDGSLKRLKTDYIDLYQLHWPDRPMRIFEGLDYVHLEGDTHSIDDILGVLGEFVDQGKIRFIGLSNETPWGVMRSWGCHASSRISSTAPSRPDSPRSSIASR